MSMTMEDSIKRWTAKRKHVGNGMLSPAEFERQQIMRREGV